MKTKYAAVLIGGLIAVTAWFAVESTAGPEAAGKVAGADRSTNVYYTLRSGGSENFTPARRAPATNSVAIAFLERLDRISAWMRITNGEPCEVLVWNVRVQKPSKSKGTDGLGWDTVYDDYPEMQTAHLRAGVASKFKVPVQVEGPWRVCVLFSKEANGKAQSQPPTTFTDSIEAISPVYPDLDEMEKTGR